MRRAGAALLAALLLAALPAASPALAGEPGAEGARPRVDCRYPAGLTLGEPPAAEAPGSAVSTLLPDDDLFRPLLADPRQPRFFANYARVHLRGPGLPIERGGRTINAALVGIGGAFGLWGLRQPRGCDGLQLSVFGSIFSQFNLDTDSDDLLNTDFLVGPQLTLRRGRWSGRLRLYHQSSHLGDEFLLNAPEVVRQDLSFEVVDALASLEGRWWRLYGGGGAIVHDSDDPNLDPWGAQWGLELRGPGWRPWTWLKSTRLVPVLGADFLSWQEREWTVTTSVSGGLEWSAPGAARRVRLLLRYVHGANPYGQFFQQKVESAGVGLQLEF
jgi:Protein of unknown function (DUF1207)